MILLSQWGEDDEINESRQGVYIPASVFACNSNRENYVNINKNHVDFTSVTILDDIKETNKFFFAEGPSLRSSFNQFLVHDLLRVSHILVPNAKGTYHRQTMEQAVDIAADIIAASACLHAVPMASSGS